MSVCLFVCLSVPKDFANRLTDRILLNRVAAHRSREGLRPSQEKSSLEKKTLFDTKIRNGGEIKFNPNTQPP